MLSTIVADEMETVLTLEVANVAMSAGPFGMVFGVQFVAVFQSPLVGFKFHVALPAWTALIAPSERVRTMARETIGNFMAAIVPMARLKEQADL